MSEGKRSLRHRLSHKLSLPENIFAVIALLVMVPLALLTPAGSNHDEYNHVRRVEQICRGQITPVFLGYAEGYPVGTDSEKDEASLYGGTIDKNLGDVLWENTLRVQADMQKYVFPTWNDQKSQIDKRWGADGTAPYSFTNTAINIPVVYAPFVPGYLLGILLRLPVYWIVVLMRLGGVAAYVLAVYWCIAHIPFARWQIMALALFPTPLATCSAVTSDTVTNISCLILMTLCLSMVVDAECSRSPWALLAIVSALLPTAKLAYTPFLLFLLLPLVNPRYQNTQSVVRLGLCGVLGLSTLAIWSHVISGINPGAMWKPGSIISPSGQVDYILHNPLRYIKSLLLTVPFDDLLLTQNYGLFALGRTTTSYYMSSPGWACSALLAVSMAANDSRDLLPDDFLTSKRSSAIFLVLPLTVAALCIVLIYTAMYLTFVPVGYLGFDGVQARYFFPVTAILIVLVKHVLTYPDNDAQVKTAQEVPQTRAEHRRKMIRALTMVLVLLVEFSLIVHVRFTIFV